MSQFKDKKGRVWELNLDLYTAREIDHSDYTVLGVEAKDFSILRPDKQTFHRLLVDASFMFAVIWVMVRKQAMIMHSNDKGTFPFSPKDEPEAAEQEFVSGVNGKVIEEAREAFVEALSDFFPDHRTVLYLLLNQMKKLAEKTAAKLAETGPMLEELMDAELDAGIARLKADFQKMSAEKRGETSSPSPAMSG